MTLKLRLHTLSNNTCYGLIKVGAYLNLFMIIHYFRHISIKKKTCLTVGFFLFLLQGIYCQQQSHLDSLVSLYETGKFEQQDKLSILKKIVDNFNDPEKILAYSNILILEAQKDDSIGYVYQGLTKKGYAFQLKSDYSKALESYFDAAKIVNRGLQTGALYINIADVYSNLNKHNNAVDYYQKAIAILKSENDSLMLASAYYNLGDEYLNAGNLSAALSFTKQAEAIFIKINDLGNQAYCLGSLGMIYGRKDNYILAEFNLNKSIELLESLNEYAAICEFLLSMSNIKHEKKEYESAKKYAFRSLELAQKYGLKKSISSANLTLSNLFEKTGNQQKALTYYKDFVTYRDSVHNLESVQKVADLHTDFEISKKQKEVDLLATRNKLRIAERNGFVFASLLLAVLLMISVYFYTQRAKRNKLLVAQKMQESEIIHQKNLMQSVITSQEAERKRIGMDLHDEVGAALSTLRIKIGCNADKEPTDHEVTAQYKVDIDKIIANMRNISHALSPRISGSFGFYDAIHELADGVNRSGNVSMTVDFDESKMPFFTNEQVPMALYRVIAELLNNTLKHAQANHIQLVVEVTDETMKIDYSDDGIGIQQKEGRPSNGIGMQNIESRLGIINADWQIVAPQNGGYGVIISVPLK